LAIDPGRAELVEGVLGEQGISVLFYEEPEGGSGHEPGS
jgi:hypothetical protein